MPISYIATGGYYSLAITNEGFLYGWGEAKLGQLGCGKQRVVQLPQKIVVQESEETLKAKPHSEFTVGDNERKNDTKEHRVVLCSAGYGHTAALTDEGELLMWGFNCYGQLGTGDKKTRWRPVRVERDIIGS